MTHARAYVVWRALRCLCNLAEEGVFLALDLGGTNFRVLLLQLAAGQLVREQVKQYHIR